MLAGFLFTPAFLLKVPGSRVFSFSMKKANLKLPVKDFNCLHWVGLPLKPRDVLQLEPKCLMDLRSAGHCIFSLPEVSRSCEPPEEQLNNGSTWRAPPCAEDWETGEELPHLLPSSWSCPPAPLARVWGQGCFVGHFASYAHSYERGSLYPSGLAWYREQSKMPARMSMERDFQSSLPPIRAFVPSVQW